MRRKDNAAAAGWIARDLQDNPPRARSLIVTLFGDTVMPYRDTLWLGDLITLLAPFGVNERLVRTSVSRLSEAGWLIGERRGRRSFYTLAPSGQRRFRHAYQRVYQPPEPWQGGWVIAVTTKDLSATDRARLRRELEWEGFAASTTGVFLRPTDDPRIARELVDGLQLTPQVALFPTKQQATPEGLAISRLTAQSWNLAPAADAYARFRLRFAPLLSALDQGTPMTAIERFMIQTLTIDAFRWATLKDPRLPAALLPADWPGHAARELCAQLYRHLYAGTRDHLAQTLKIKCDALPLPAAVTTRFTAAIPSPQP
ncbi:MAG TPA: PaaX family transcriptional regulator C-terminal domain-containing protein [Nevskiaceae bacterium]|nr:PaaX family transcriptional regulator C-terminal domain-containing protein [Nevskiaceae bacterium]